jgi:enoyl-CoA hydratase/carnithine racemase
MSFWPAAVRFFSLPFRVSGWCRTEARRGCCRGLSDLRARRSWCFGGTVAREKALQWGLVNQVHDDDKLLDALCVGDRLSARPTRTLALTRRACWASLDNPFDEQLELEAGLQAKPAESAISSRA